MKKVLRLLLVLIFMIFAFTACNNTGSEGVLSSPSDNANYDSSSSDTESLWLLSTEYRDGKLFCIHKYNSDGFISETTSFSDGAADGKFVYEYDENGNKIIDNYVDKDGNIAIENTSTYDDNGNIIKRVTKNGNTTEILTYQYDSNANVLEFVRESNGKIVEKEVYEYAENGRCSNMKYYYGIDGPAAETKYTYDGGGNLIVEARYYEGEEKSRHEYTYNENGKVIEELSYENGEHISSIEYSYDENGNQTEWASYFRGEEDIRVRYDYSDKGLMLKETSLNADGSVRFEVVYEYDEYGNKTKDTTSYVSLNGDASENIYEYTEINVPAKYVEKVKNQFVTENRNFY